MLFNRLPRFVGMPVMAALMLATPARAAVVAIDQRAALAGRVTAQDTPGFPVTISEPGSYRLTSNLTVPSVATTVIQITADNVTLDLNGFSIIGPNVCTSNPITCTALGGGIGIMAVSEGVPSPANVRVMNGMVRGMGGHGIRMMGDSTVVERVLAVSNGGPGIVVGNGRVIDSEARLSGSGTAIVGLHVRGCTAANNVFGIFVRPGGVASGNVAMANEGGGIAVTNGTATGNTAINNVNYGIDAICPGTLTGNTAFGNTVINIRTNGQCTGSDNAQ